MARPHKPWYRKPRDTWYVEIDGKQHALCKGADNRKLAEQEMYRLLAEQENPTSAAEKKTVVALFAKFLGWTKRHRAQQTYDQHKHFLKSFVSDPKRRKLPAHKVTVAVVEDWLDENKGWKRSRRHAIRTLLRAFNWAVRRQVLAKNPILGIEVPGKSRVVNYLTREQRDAIVAGIRDRPFKNFLTAMKETGCRPGEVAAVTAADVDLAAGTWTLQQHKTAGKTGKPRVVYLTETALALTRELVAQNPVGPLFRGRKNAPYTRNAIRIRFRRLRKKYPAFGHFTSYSFRKGFVTDALEKGVGVAQVAELVGHTSTEMVMRHYSMLQERTQHMREMAEKATG
jgi:integrase